MSVDPRFHEVQVEETKFVVLRRYQDLEPIPTGIRRGDRGATCLATDTVTGEEVTIEKLSRPYSHPTIAKRTIRDLKLWSSLNHENTVRLNDIFAPPVRERIEDIYFVMPKFYTLVESFLGTTYEYRNKFTPAIGGISMYYTLLGLEHLNSAGIIYGDLKRVDSGFRGSLNYFILNFGLPRCAVAKLNLLQHEEANCYRSPEVILGMDFGPKADIWSLGCMLAEMLTGQVFFEGANQKEQWDKITEILGTPSQEFINRLNPRFRDFVSSRPVHKGIPFEDMFPEIPDITMKAPNYDNVCDLVSKMLVVDPEVRISVEQALDHPSFDHRPKIGRNLKLYRPATEIYNDSLEGKDLSPGQWRQLIFEQVRFLEQRLNLQAAKY